MDAGFLHDNAAVFADKMRRAYMSYIGQTNRNLNQRYQEHIRYIRNNDPHSAYAQHILQNLQEYRSITDTMSLLRPIHT